MREIAEIICISTDRVVNILHAHLCMRKLCKMGATIAHNRPKTHSCDHFEAKFGLFYPQSEKVLHRFVTTDETQFHHYTPKSREGSKQWFKPGESVLKRPKTQQSAGNAMFVFFVCFRTTLF